MTPDPKPGQIDETRIPLDTWTPPPPPDDGSPWEPPASSAQIDADVLGTGLI